MQYPPIGRLGTQLPGRRFHQPILSYPNSQLFPPFSPLTICFSELPTLTQWGTNMPKKIMLKKVIWTLLIGKITAPEKKKDGANKRNNDASMKKMVLSKNLCKRIFISFIIIISFRIPSKGD